MKTTVLSITSGLAALSGVMQSSEIMSGTATTAKGWELDVTAPVIIGGTSLMGGVGRVWGTMVGVVFLGVIINGMTLLNIDVHTRYIVEAVIMFLAVLLSSYRAKIKA